MLYGFYWLCSLLITAQYAETELYGICRGMLFKGGIIHEGFVISSVGDGPYDEEGDPVLEADMGYGSAFHLAAGSAEGIYEPILLLF